MSAAVVGAVVVCAAGPVVVFVAAMVNRAQPKGVALARWSARWWLDRASAVALQVLITVGVMMLWHLLGWPGALLGLAVAGSAVGTALGAATVMGRRRRRREAGYEAR